MSGCGTEGCSTCSTGCARTSAKKLWLLGTGAMAAISFVTVMLFTSKVGPSTAAEPAMQNVAFKIPKAWQIHPEQIPLIPQMPHVRPIAVQVPQGMFVPGRQQNSMWTTPQQLPQMMPMAMTRPPTRGLAGVNMGVQPMGGLPAGQVGMMRSVAMQIPMAPGTPMMINGERETPPPITRQSGLPHEFRGVCSNCHIILETPNRRGQSLS